MKKGKIIFCLIITFLFIEHIYAEDKNIIQYSSTLPIASELEITDITSNKEAYFIMGEDTANTKILKYNLENTLLATKELPGLTSPKMIKWKDTYLVVGKSSNSLKIYVLDSNLKIQNQNNSEVIISPQAEINLYKKENRVYIMLTKNNLLESNQIYEIEENLTITSQNLSYYDSTFLKEILQGDYDLIHNNNQMENNEIIHYVNTTYKEEKNLLIGWKEKENNTNVAVLSQIDKTTKEETTKEYPVYKSFKDIALINDKFLVLATNQIEEDYLLTIDNLGNIENEEKINVTADKLFKIGNHLVVSSPNTHSLLFYEYKLNIKVNESLFGTIDVPETAIPYENILVEVQANSGYEVEAIYIKDEQGQVLAMSDTQEFTMPENDVTISVSYKEKVKNPETTDIILIIAFVFLGITGILYICNRKLHWLK